MATAMNPGCWTPLAVTATGPDDPRKVLVCGVIPTGVIGTISERCAWDLHTVDYTPGEMAVLTQ